MRVLENNYVEKTIKVRCSSCTSLLEVRLGDIEVAGEMVHHGPAQWCNCKCCGSKASIKLNDIPNGWRWLLFSDEDDF